MEEKAVQYAGFWRRFAAFVIDMVILAFANYEFLSYQSTSMSVIANLGYYNFTYANYGLMIAVYSILISWVYFCGMESSPLQATPGKLAVGIYVTDLEGQRIGFGKATGRYFAKIISGLMVGIGFIMAGYTDKRQAFHDKITNCLVLGK